MTWVKLDDQFPDHPKVVAAGPAAGWLFIAGLSYCARYLTDGFIPKDQIRRLADLEGVTDLAEKLASVGLWEVVEGGFQVHDYLDYQPSAEKVKAERAANAKRQAGWRNRNDVTNTVTNGPVTPAPYPYPSKEDGGIPPLVPPTDTKESPPSRKRKLPDDFAVTDEMRQVAESFGVPPDKVDFETQRFKDWAAGGERKVDWVATWRNWMARSVRMSGYDRLKPPTRASPNGRQGGMTAQELADLARRLEEQGQ